MSNRDAFLARVRLAVEQGRPYRVPLQPVPENIGYIGVEGDLVERFALEVNEVGGQAYVVPDLAAAGQQLHLLLAEADAQSAVVWQHDLLDRLGLRELLAAPGVQALDYDSLNALPADERRRALLACDVGITSCDCAIAETGTLMVCSQPGHERVASLLPPMHIAIIERRQIVADLIDAFEWLAAGESIAAARMTNDQASMTNQIQNPKSKIQNLPSNVTFITGPSKTGDIELQLTTGVHGPGKWRVIVVT